MGIGILPLGKVVRLAIVTGIGSNYVKCSFIDKFGEKSFNCPMPHPYAGRGGGVLVGIERDTLVLVANGPQEQWFIVAIVPDVNFSFDVEGAQDIRVGETSYPKLSEGEICLKGNPGQVVSLLKNGNIAMDANIGNKSYDFELSNLAQGMFVRVNNVYRFTEAGRYVEGIVKRDVNEKEDPQETRTTDFLTSESYDRMLTPIGRSPADEVHDRTTTLFKAITRNPALVEKREIIYEFGESFNVRNFDQEQTAMRPISQGNVGEIQDSVSILRTDPSIRENRRTDVLDMNLRNYNHLIENVQGTLVDIYGNVLDINRHKIDVPEVETIVDQRSGTFSSNGLKRMYDFLRRSIKYHFEINSRKPDANEQRIPENAGIPSDNLTNHSRFSIDIDAEGLTKINIPASSETGNIPILGRYSVGRDLEGESLDNGAYRDQERVDVRINQFGAKKVDSNEFSGQVISDTSYLPKTTNNIPITVGSAFHDLFNIANSIFTNGKLKSPDLSGSTILPLNTEINNRIVESNETPIANAGGRSLHLNLDGSLESSIGSDTIDRKSIGIDAAGGMISHIGRDRNGRSIISQTDGDIIIQVGGLGVKDPRFEAEDENGEVFVYQDGTVPSTENRAGRLEIHFIRPNSDPSKIIIDEGGITIRSEGRMRLESAGNMVISSESDLLINAESIYKFGKMDDETGKISAELRQPRKGRIGS